VSFGSRHGVLAVRSFQIELQAVTALSISGDPVRVTGRVTLNHAPAPQVRIRFVGDADRPATTADTDADGVYVVAFARSGSRERVLTRHAG
jgi:hypothetical protein